MWNMTKIVATMGPACRKKTVLRAMFRAGADCIRLNGAHGDKEEMLGSIRLVREVSASMGLHIPVLVDLPGPKHRIGRLAKDPMFITNGSTVRILCDSSVQKGEAIPCPHPLHRYIQPGQSIYINDGLVGLKVVSISGKTLVCRATSSGEIRSMKGVNLPRVPIPAPALTAADRVILDTAIRGGADVIGLSFVRKAAHVKTLKEVLRKRAPGVRVIAKIEKPEALDDFDNILDAADGVMVARGDLGIELPFDQVPHIQKRILERTLAAGKLSITATQMLLSMVSSARPTRAEANDVAHAVWEGTSAVMLSEETSVGTNPVTAVAAMARIARSAEADPACACSHDDHMKAPDKTTLHMAEAAAELAARVDARLIIVPSQMGRTALWVSTSRPPAPIVGVSAQAMVARQLGLMWGVHPVLARKNAHTPELIEAALKEGGHRHWVKKGDAVVIAYRTGASGSRVHHVDVRRVG